MTRKIKRFDPSKLRDWRAREAKPQTAAQEAATRRNFQIVRLRGLWYAVTMLSPARRGIVQAHIDNELIDLGAEPQGVRRARERAEFEAELATRREQREP